MYNIIQCHDIVSRTRAFSTLAESTALGLRSSGRAAYATSAASLICESAAVAVAPRWACSVRWRTSPGSTSSVRILRIIYCFAECPYHFMLYMQRALVTFRPGHQARQRAGAHCHAVPNPLFVGPPVTPAPTTMHGVVEVSLWSTDTCGR